MTPRPDTPREAAVRRMALDGYSYAEIADALGIVSRSAVAGICARRPPRRDDGLDLGRERASEAGGGDMSGDLNIQMTVRNGRLLRAIRDQYGTSAELCRRAGLSHSQVSALVTMRDTPFRADGSLTVVAEGVVSALGMTPDELWPEHIARLKAKTATVEVEMSLAQFAAISEADPERMAIYRSAIARWGRHLTERERNVLAARSAGATLDEAGAEIGAVSKERVRQIEGGALRKMRKAARIDGVKTFEGVT